jgi:hypothetical protein
MVKSKPIISYWKSSDPCYNIPYLEHNLTDITIIHTKHLSDEFVNLCLKYKNKIFLHINITGMAKTIFEPKIPTVKETFTQIKKLITSGFSQKQILVSINPILPNENGLKALKLLLKLFTEFSYLRLRFVRFNVLKYKEGIIGNENISKRKSIKGVLNYLSNDETFWKEYNKLLEEYSSIISVDKGDEALIGIRELLAFGYKNEWIDENGNRTKLIFYDKGNKYKPLVNIISSKVPIRCKNQCLLCPWLY